MLRFLGILVLLYVAYAFSRGEVYAKDGWRWKVVLKDESPGYFSAVVAVYILLGITLIFVH